VRDQWSVPRCCGVRQCIYHMCVEALVTAALSALSRPCMARGASRRARDTSRRVHNPVLLTREPSRMSFTSQRTVEVSRAAEPSFVWTLAPDDLLEGRETHTQEAELPTDVTLRFACVLLLADTGSLRALRSRATGDVGKLSDDHWPMLTIFWTSEHSAQDVIRATLSFYDSCALLVGFRVRLLEEREGKKLLDAGRRSGTPVRYVAEPSGKHGALRRYVGTVGPSRGPGRVAAPARGERDRGALRGPRRNDGAPSFSGHPRGPRRDSGGRTSRADGPGYHEAHREIRPLRFVR